jgi:alcohol dehydrogenase class IV
MTSLPRYYRNPDDRNASENMAWGSCMAGIAFNSARVGLAHAVASAIGPLTGLSHGICVGLGLPEAVRLNLKSRAEDRSDLMAHLGVNIATDLHWESAVCAHLAKFYVELDFPKTVRDAGCSFQVNDDLVQQIISSGRLETNPARIGRETLRDVLVRIHG